MKALFYQLKSIPDLELAKYQSLGEQGVEGVLKRHNNFLRQWQRYSENMDVDLHLYIFYCPNEAWTDKLGVYFSITFMDDSMASRLNALISSSPISSFFYLENISEDKFDENQLNYSNFPHQ